MFKILKKKKICKILIKHKIKKYEALLQIVFKFFILNIVSKFGYFQI